RRESVSASAEQAKLLGADFSKPTDTLAKAQASADKGDFEHAFGSLGIAESEARAAVSKGLLARFDGLKERAEVLQGTGVDVGRLSSAISQGREMARTEKLAEGMEAWRTAEDLTRSMEMERLVEMISRLRGRLLIANKTGADIAGVMDMLDRARTTLAQGDFRAAAITVKEAEAILERLLEGYREMEAELTRTRGLMTVAIDLKLNITEAKHKVDASRHMALKRDFAHAIRQLKEAQEIIHSAIQAHIGQDIMRAEMRVTNALKVGADISEESALLEEIVSRTKAGRYEKVREDLDLCIRKVDAKVHQIAERKITEARNLLDTYEGPVNISMHRNALDRRLEEVRSLLAITKDMGSESSTLNDRLLRAEEHRSNGNISESLRVAAEVLQFARSMVKDEVTRQLAQISRGISAARKNGIEVLPAERLAEEASRALAAGDLLKGYSLMKESSSTLERLTTVHARIYERIVEISALLKEADAQHLDASAQMEMLARAKRLFEAGRYEEALPAIAKTFVETERLVAPFAAPRKAQAAQDLISVAKRLGYEVTAPQKRLDQANKLIERKEYAQAMISVREVEKTVVSVLTKGVEKQLLEAKEMLQRAQAMGTDVSGPQQIVAKAESLIRERRLYDALRALELAKSELDQGLLMSEKAADTMERAQAIIDDAKGFGAQVEPAAELLRQARNYHKMGRHGIAHELAKKAGDQAGLESAELVRKRMRAAESACRQKGLEGADLQAALRIREDAERRIEGNRFREAMAQAATFERELERLQAQKELSAQSLNEVGAKLSKARSKGLATQGEEAILTQARDRFAQGAFFEAQAMAAKCEGELKAKEDIFQRRMAELKALEAEAAQLEDEEAASQPRALAEAARKSMAELDFEAASLHLRRGRQALKEAGQSIQAERMKNLENMCMVAEELKLNKNSIPKVVKDVAQLRGTKEAPDPRKLREAVTAMNEVMAKKLAVRIEAAHENIEEARRNGADVSASTELLSKASRMLSEGKWRGAANCVMEAERSIGVQVEEQRRYVDTRMRVEARIEGARRNGLEMPEVVRLYREAERAKEKDHAAAVQLMEQARAQAEREAEDFLPDIEVSLRFDAPLRQGEWSKATLLLGNEAKAMAREVSVQLSGEMEMRGFAALPKLRGGERVAVEVEVRPSAQGKAKVSLALECRPVLSNDKVGYDTEFEVDV
ncbi:MAG: hypothetical protein MUE65_05630, partial [Methanomassiliicoccales archaeon]|nr:hypothetical protein [Methanomassiliicoccales archaeon]